MNWTKFIFNMIGAMWYAILIAMEYIKITLQNILREEKLQ